MNQRAYQLVGNVLHSALDMLRPAATVPAASGSSRMRRESDAK